MPSEIVVAGPSWEESVAEGWLAKFARAVESRNTNAIMALFVADAWWRDLVALSWNLRSLNGRDNIERLLNERLDVAGLGKVELYEGFTPATVAGAASVPRWIELLFRFETALGRGRGLARLVPDSAEDDWKAWIVTTSLEELKGYEEPNGIRRPRGEAHRADSRRETWMARRTREREFVDEEPTVVVIGAGHSGLGLAARLGQLNIPTLIVDRNQRVGDNWRRRYHSLVLHDPVHIEHLPYLPFPKTWPMFCPKDKFADWLEAYANVMELNVWNGTEIVSATYDETTEKWTVHVIQHGVNRTVHPAHLVFAIGPMAEPVIPEWPGQSSFSGTISHSSDYVDGREFTGRRVLVVGACNSGLDIARDLWEFGAMVTVLQRSSTYLYSIWTGLPRLYDRLYSEASPQTDDADLLRYVPNMAGIDLMQENVRATAELDRELLDGLAAAGFKTNMGEFGAGQKLTALRSGGGYAIDVGCADLIVNREVKVKQGVEIERFTHSGVVFTDETSMELDAVVLATGFSDMRDAVRPVIGDEMADRCRPAWGLDQEGEINGMYRPTGQPGLWFASHGLGDSRMLSRHLALQLKARVQGLVHFASDAPQEPSDTGEPASTESVAT